MKNLFLAGPAFRRDGVTLIDGEARFVGLTQSQVPAFETVEELLSQLKPTANATNVSIIRVTIEAIPFPERS